MDVVLDRNVSGYRLAAALDYFLLGLDYNLGTLRRHFHCSNFSRAHYSSVRHRRTGGAAAVHIAMVFGVRSGCYGPGTESEPGAGGTGSARCVGGSVRVFARLPAVHAFCWEIGRAHV